MGSEKAGDVIKHAIAMGADDGYVLCDPGFENLDSFGTASVLAKAIEKIGAYDLILCGRQAADWGAGQVGSILGEMLDVPVVTLACDIEGADGSVKVKRIVSDGYEIVEAPLPSLVTVSSEIGMPRLPAGVRLMMARKKQIPIWKAADIAVDAPPAHTEVTSLTVPVRKTECEIIGGAPADAAATLATKLASLI
jgi:electron transfer flavoprotein beta subunit